MVGRKILKNVKLSCEKMLFGGLGLCRTQSGVVFVEGLLPNESADCQQVRKSGGTQVFKVQEIFKTSPRRRDCFCKYFGTCGGCDWQFMDYDFQRSCKKEIFEDVMRRIGKIYDFLPPEIFSADEKNYRIRVKFSIDKKVKKLGFLSKKSHEIIDIENCPLLSENLNAFLADRNQIFEQSLNLKEIKLIDCGNEVVSSLNKKIGEICVEKYKFEVSWNSFFQANKFITRTMANWCESNIFKCENLLDVYGGVGLFSVFCSKKARNITLLEVDEIMAKSAQKTFDNNGIKNAKAIGLSAEKFLKSKNIKPDCIIVDPPRIGLSKEVRTGIRSLSPEKIVYVSCDISTQARDCNFFVNECGYKIEKTAIFDCYPNTFHIESGVILTR
ncbi:MAG: RsmD family RNA methyltransferase [Chitinispirillales bacterium]|jgi:23S rRNA (uracil1939-C5)-methyltransferase|nr:RsmD family RNA methyltransferase [Chitinispirillales bacterium]